MAKRILLVDDHPPTLALIRAVLDAEKYQDLAIHEATTGTDALKTFDRGGPFDLVLLDVGLPDIDGFTVCRALRKVDARVPIIFITAKGELKDFATGREAGGDSYLVKPISRAALRNLLNVFLNVQRANGRTAGGG
jgi:DNA-binding response OmpR family regulator